APDFDALEKTLRPRPRDPTEWTAACVDAAVACGFRASSNLNDGDLGNVIGHETMAYEGDRRRSSYVAFIRDRPVPNLTILTGEWVKRITFDGVRASGVEVGEKHILARREIIVCAGALETPKLLMLSGI